MTSPGDGRTGGNGFIGEASMTVGGLFNIANAGAMAIGMADTWQGYRGMGLGRWDTGVMMFHPMVGMAEALEGRSYGVGDFGEELMGGQRAFRGLWSVGETGLVVAGGAGLASRGITAGIRATVPRGGGRFSTFLRNQAAGSYRRSGIAPQQLAQRRNLLVSRKFQGPLGETLTRLERLMHFERTVGTHITLQAGGEVAVVDAITRRIFSRQLRVVEAKFGRTARRERGQRVVYPHIQRFGTAVARGPKAVRILRPLDYSGSVRRGVPLKDLIYIEQRFPVLERTLVPALRKSLGLFY